MPELPEVETTIRELSKKIVGKKIVDFWTDAENLIKRPSLEKFKKGVVDKKITRINRRGKNILIYLDENYLLLVHQKLTGHLLYGLWEKRGNSWLPKTNIENFSDPYNRFLHLIFFLDDGKMLALSDMRKFAKVIYGKKDEILNSKDLEVGVEPLSKEFTLEKFKEILKSQKRPIKTVLMDQELIAGIGNVYSDESLWMARISPLRKANSLKDDEIKRLYQAIKKILKKAIELQGTSIIDYRKPDGSKGKMDKFLKVYRKEGEKCPRCKGIIKRVIINGRSAHYCPKCQK